MRIGTHQNTAYALKLLNEYARATGNAELQAGVAERRPRPVLEFDAVKPHRDGNAADKGGVELADQDHGASFLPHV